MDGRRNAKVEGTPSIARNIGGPSTGETPEPETFFNKILYSTL
jgi:hypothetical protein